MKNCNSFKQKSFLPQLRETGTASLMENFGDAQSEPAAEAVKG
jgi:hypothetical protein